MNGQINPGMNGHMTRHPYILVVEDDPVLEKVKRLSRAQADGRS
jgi:hypothetical protein